MLSSSSIRRSRRSLVRTLPASVLLLLSLAPSPISAQVGTILDKSKLPACAFNCQSLINAQTVCVPPSAPQTDQGTYQTCFCTSNYLVTFKTSPVDICGGVCTAAELQTIQTWFTGLCNGGAVVTPNGGGTATTTTSTSSTQATGAGSSSQPKKSGKSNPSWISTHYKWIIMLIILILAGIGGIFLGLWLKRRKRTQRELRHRDSTLGVEDAVASMRSRHPEMGSTTNIPNWERASQAMSSREMIAGTPPPRGAYGTPPPHGHGHSPRGKPKQEVIESQAPDMHSAIASEDDSRGRSMNPIRIASQKLKKKPSKKGRG